MRSPSIIIKLIMQPELETSVLYDGLSFIFFEAEVTVYDASMESTALNTSWIHP